MSDGDQISISVKSGITTTFVVKYDDGNRRLLINPVGFAATQVNSTNNSFTLYGHGFKQGEKVLHNSDSPSGGLEDSRMSVSYTHLTLPTKA